MYEDELSRLTQSRDRVLAASEKLSDCNTPFFLHASTPGVGLAFLRTENPITFDFHNLARLRTSETVDAVMRGKLIRALRQIQEFAGHRIDELEDVR